MISERKCPRCLRKMKTIETVGPQIECCARGDGYWLDGGELLELIEASGHPAADFLEQMFLSNLEKRRFETDSET
ncbi:zf-TFIIB domain-containing protein [bacterium]|nr:zf-TFIIB domain-containing protein [bacterium]